MLALVAVFLATFKDWRPYLQPGERAVIMILASDRRRSRVIFRYVRELLFRVPALKQDYWAHETKESIDLTVPVTIECHTSNFRAVRGYAIAAALFDECAFWPSDDSANPDVEVLNAIRPAMSSLPGSMLLAASSPYARKGALYQAWQRHFGKETPVLYWQAPTRTMNPTIPQSLIDEALAADPAAAGAEYMAQFRSDVASFVDRAAVESCVVPGRRELPPIKGINYRAFTAPSGGRGDAMTLAIAHADDGRVVVDLIREIQPPFSPESAVDEFASLLRAYRVHSVPGDRYGAAWVEERFKRAGVHYVAAEKAKSDLYVSLLPAINSGQIELLDHPKSVNQICSLERKTSRAGRDSIDHGPGAHDDLANCLAGAVFLLRRKSSNGPRVSGWPYVRDDDPDRERKIAEAHAKEEARIGGPGDYGRTPGFGYYTGGDFGDWVRNG